jgi:hypothetical protein
MPGSAGSAHLRHCYRHETVDFGPPVERLPDDVDDEREGEGAHGPGRPGDPIGGQTASVPQMTGGRPELVSARTRRAVREMMSGTVLRDIDGMWQDEGFAPRSDEDPAVGGQRVSRFQSYLDQVDWTDRAHVDRALRVFENALADIDEQYLAGVRRHLERDGYSFVDGRIAGGPMTAGVRERSLSAVEDPAAIREHLDRISRALADDDPRQAIGSAKELIESTAKLVLRSRGLAVNDRDDFPELVRAAQMTLEVRPRQATPGPDGSDAVRQGANRT